MVTVVGIARNGIMLVSHYRHLEMEERVPLVPIVVLAGPDMATRLSNRSPS